MDVGHNGDAEEGPPFKIFILKRKNIIEVKNKLDENIEGPKMKFVYPKKIEVHRIEIYETRILGDQKSGVEIYRRVFKAHILIQITYLK